MSWSDRLSFSSFSVFRKLFSSPLLVSMLTNMLGWLLKYFVALRINIMISSPELIFFQSLRNFFFFNLLLVFLPMIMLCWLLKSFCLSRKKYSDQIVQNNPIQYLYINTNLLVRLVPSFLNSDWKLTHMNLSQNKVWLERTNQSILCPDVLFEENKLINIHLMKYSTSQSMSRCPG